jgi:plasmid stability protein
MPEKVFVRNIPDDLWRAVKARASLEGITVSEAVKRALSQYLAGVRDSPAQRGAFDGIIGLFADDAPDVSERHDYYLAEEPAAYDVGESTRRKKK